MDEKVKTTSNILKLSIGTAAFLALAKFSTGFVTHSMAVMTSALDSAMDVAVSSVNLVAARQAAKPPDECHAYGHGKIESLAGLFQSLFIGLSGLFLVVESLRRWFAGTYVKSVSVGLGVMIFSIAVTALLVWRLRTILRQQKSMILAAEQLHYGMDILTNGGVLLALVLVHITHWVFWDLLVSISVAVYILWSSFQILRESINELLDRSLSSVSRSEIQNFALSYHPAIVGIHNFRGHRVGGKLFLDFHIELRGEKYFRHAHTVSEGLIQELKQRYPEADVTVHYDPEGEE
ncbi:MAG: cation diffusion facilitator family transporter [Candidatus Omnitrophica bacterium]|nr:cation diffusion facilitator family transporter [Candidatus Omnitrophota bacterium]